jgi:hypothetical protein
MRLRSAVLAAAALALPLIPTAAQANTYTYQDQPNDIVKVTMPAGTTEPAPERTQGDIVSSQVKHKARKVILTMRYQELTPDQVSIHWYGIRTGKMARIAILHATPSHPAGKVRLFKPNGKPVTCQVGHSIDYTANTATVRVPRSCLGNPRWVKVAMQEATPISQTEIYVDDSRSTGGMLPLYGPRVFR